jgi:hypothetical protein
MNKETINKFWLPALIFAVVAILLYVLFFVNFGELNGLGKKVDLNTLTDQEIIQILKTNADVADYISRNPEFAIQSKEILTKDAILRGQNQNTFQPVYIALELEDSRYLKVQLMNAAGSEGYITVIDANDSSVQKAFGMLLIQMSQQQIESQIQESGSAGAQ